MVAGVAVLVLAAALVLVAVLSIRNVGRIKVFNLECDTTQIDWGDVTPGMYANYTVNVKVSEPSTLQMFTENWNPPVAADYLSLTWDYVNGTVIGAGTWTPVTLTLHCLESAKATGFSFGIVLNATSTTD